MINQGLILEGPYTVIPVPTQRGISSAFCRRQTGRYNPTTGWTLDQDFNSLSIDAMIALSDVYGAAGIEYEITYQNGMATMRTTDTTGNITVDVWEVTASREAASVFGSPQVKLNVSSNDLTVLAYAYINGMDLADAVAALNGTTPAPGTPYTQPDVQISSATQRLYSKTKIAGEDTYLIDRYSLRHTTNASNRGRFNIADSNVNCIYTQARLYSEITNPGYWIFPAPPEIIGALNVVFAGLAGYPPVGLTGAPLNVITGALKGGSTRTTAARERINITTVYDIGIIDADDYFSAV